MKNQIELTQSPVISHDLQSIGANVTARIEELNINNLVATPDTISSMKKLRAELNREAKDFEEQRKAVKKAVNDPYLKFEEIYKSEVIEKYKGAVDTLKTKIGAFEMKIKDEKQANIESYFNELCLSEKIDFIKFSQLNLKIDLSTSEKKYKEFCNEYISKVQEDIKLIESETYQAEIMAEYKKTLNSSKAITDVRARKEAEKQEKERILAKRTQAREAQARNLGLFYSDMIKAFTSKIHEEIFIKQSDIENLPDDDFIKLFAGVEAKVLAILAEEEKAKEGNKQNECKKPEPTREVLQAPKEEVKEEIFNAVFEVKGTMQQLKALGAYMNENNINYKNI